MASKFNDLKNIINYQIRLNNIDVEEVVSFFATTICLHLAEEPNSEELFEAIIDGMKRLYKNEMGKRNGN